MKKYKWKIFMTNLLNILVLIIVFVTLLFSVLLVREKLLQNTQDLGMALAQSYASEEETHISTFQDVLDLGAQYVDELYAEGNVSEIQQWIQDYLKKISSILGENLVDPYAVIDGEIVAANPWEGNADYDYKSTEWYQKAVAGEGEAIFTDVYQDAITQQPVVTMAKQLTKTGDVMVMDIYPANLHQQDPIQELPAKSSFYLCDSKGNVITFYTPWEISQEAIDNNAKYLIEGIRDGSLLSYSASFEDYEGKERGAYCHEMSNGWMVILTIPFESILMGEWNVVILVLAGVGLFLFTVLLVMSLWNLFQMKKIHMWETTVRILGDSFYAIYILDYAKGTYEFLKPSEDVAREVPLRGEYKNLMSVIQKYVDPEAQQDVAQAFSLTQIRERVKNHVRDYGGDYKRKFGDTYKWVNVRTLYNPEEAENRVIVCFREVDMEKRQQQQHMEILRDALETAKRSAKEKDAFFNNMSHDMRTPLNAVIGYSELVTKNLDDTKKISDYMDKIQHAGKQLLTLINDILELSRLHSGKNILKNQEFDLRQCIHNSTQLFQQMAHQQGKILEEDIEIQDTMVMGDSFKLEQIMNNLLSNALKYSNEGDKVKVTLRQLISMERSKYQIMVEDTGIGMSEEFIQQIFDPYSREITFSTRAVLGTGLGMPIVKSLVQQMSGEITVESRLGEGSKFTVTIPLETCGKKIELPKPDREKKEENILKGCRILLAEDNPLNREIAVEILQMNGIEVTSVENGQEALECFQASAPYAFHAILMDMQMPVMDGCEAARRIRALHRPDAQSIPIIAVTANAFVEDIGKTANAGMNGHISKPIDFTVLTQTLENMIQK